MSNGHVGPIALTNVIQILNAAKSIIPSSNIKIVEAHDKLPTYKKIIKGRRGRPKSTK